MQKPKDIQYLFCLIFKENWDQILSTIGNKRNQKRVFKTKPKKPNTTQKANIRNHEDTFLKLNLVIVLPCWQNTDREDTGHPPPLRPPQWPSEEWQSPEQGFDPLQPCSRRVMRVLLLTTHLDHTRPGTHDEFYRQPAVTRLLSTTEFHIFTPFCCHIHTALSYSTSWPVKHAVRSYLVCNSRLSDHLHNG